MSRRRFLLSLAPALVAPAWAARAWATTLPRASAVPGGVARIGLGAAGQPPRVRLGSERVLVMREGGLEGAGGGGAGRRRGRALRDCRRPQGVRLAASQGAAGPGGSFGRGS